MVLLLIIEIFLIRLLLLLTVGDLLLKVCLLLLQRFLQILCSLLGLLERCNRFLLNLILYPDLILQTLDDALQQLCNALALDATRALARESRIGSRIPLENSVSVSIELVICGVATLNQSSKC